MQIEVGVGWAMSVMLLSLRIGPVLVLAPPFSQTQVPLRVRACLVLALAACLSQPISSVIYLDDGALLLSALSELLLGLMIAFAFQAAFAALSFAGRVLDVQAGYGLAMVIDPGSRGQSPLFGTILLLVAGLVFFAANGQDDLLRLLATLVQVLPVGQAQIVGAPQAFIGYFGTVIGIGLAAVSAAILILFLIDLSIAFLSRALPQMNALMLGLQIKTIVTLITRALSIGLAAPVAMRLMSAAFEFVLTLI
jgi:flagellar biosynthetic protein FliR